MAFFFKIVIIKLLQVYRHAIMGKQVIIISSSPRKGGNSDTLCDEFLKGAEEAGHNVQKIFLKDKIIKYCTGCNYCNINSKRTCPQPDEMGEISELLVRADVIVFATPIYFYTMCGQLKTFIDRCCAKHTLLTNKEFYFIMTATATEEHIFDGTIHEFKCFLSCLGNPTIKGMIKAGGVWLNEDVHHTEYPQIAYEMGKNI